MKTTVYRYAKTLYLPTRPQRVTDFLKNYTKSKTPHFFIYAKDKDADTQVEPPNQSTMNRISAAIPPSRVAYSKSIGKMDYRVLMNGDAGFTISENTDVIKSYNYWLRHQYQFNDENDNIKGCDSYAARMTRERILADSGGDIDYVVNSLVAYLYSVKQASNKKLLWDCFGWEIVDNIKRNVDGMGRICPICGRRFTPAVHNQVCCGEDCARQADIQNKRIMRETVKPIVAENGDIPQDFVDSNNI